MRRLIRQISSSPSRATQPYSCSTSYCCFSLALITARSTGRSERERVTSRGANVAAERLPLACGRRRSCASMAATKRIRPDIDVALSGEKRKSTSNGIVAPSFSSSQLVMGITGARARTAASSGSRYGSAAGPRRSPASGPGTRRRSSVGCPDTHSPNCGNSASWEDPPASAPLS